MEISMRQIQKPTSASICVLSTGVHTDNLLPQTCFTFQIPGPSHRHPALQIRMQKTLVPPAPCYRGSPAPTVPPCSALILISWSPRPLIPPWLKLVSQLVSFLQLHPSLPSAFCRTFPKPSPDSLQNQPQPPSHLPQSGPCPSACTAHISQANHPTPAQIPTTPCLHAVLMGLLCLDCLWQGHCFNSAGSGPGYGLQDESPGGTLLCSVSSILLSSLLARSM